MNNPKKTDISEMARDVKINEDGSVSFSIPNGMYSIHDEDGRLIVDEFTPISDHGVN